MAGWKDADWLVIDSETTGLDPAVDRIVELAAVVFRGGEVVSRMGMLVNPGRPIPEEATDVHHITDAMVADAPTLEEIGERFLAHVASHEVLVAYNWPFDSSMIAAGIGEGRWDEATRRKAIVDPLVVVRFEGVGKFWKGSGRYRLANAADRLDITADGKTHRASTDAVLTGKILWTVRDHLPDDGQEATRLIDDKRRIHDEEFQAWKARQPPL